MLYIHDARFILNWINFNKKMEADGMRGALSMSFPTLDVDSFHDYWLFASYEEDDSGDIINVDINGQWAEYSLSWLIMYVECGGDEATANANWEAETLKNELDELIPSDGRTAAKPRGMRI